MSTPTGDKYVNGISPTGIEISNTEKRIPTTGNCFKGGTFINASDTVSAIISFFDGTTFTLPPGQAINFSSDSGQIYQPMNIYSGVGGLVYGLYYL